MGAQEFRAFCLLSTDDSVLLVLHYREFFQPEMKHIHGIFGMPPDGDNGESLPGVVGKPGRFENNDGRSKWKIAKSEFDRGPVLPTDCKFVGNPAEKGFK